MITSIQCGKSGLLLLVLARSYALTGKLRQLAETRSMDFGENSTGRS